MATASIRCDSCALPRGLKPGEPWVAGSQGGAIAPGRRNDASVVRIVKTRRRAFVDRARQERDRSEAPHSSWLRLEPLDAGRVYAPTHSGRAGEPGYRIQHRMATIHGHQPCATSSSVQHDQVRAQRVRVLAELGTLHRSCRAPPSCKNGISRIEQKAHVRRSSAKSRMLTNVADYSSI